MCVIRDSATSSTNSRYDARFPKTIELADILDGNDAKAFRKRLPLKIDDNLGVRDHKGDKWVAPGARKEKDKQECSAVSLVSPPRHYPPWFKTETQEEEEGE